jgi:prepilin-type N-terminal cleavage/methylation domain-containing protein
MMSPVRTANYFRRFVQRPALRVRKIVAEVVNVCDHTPARRIETGRVSEGQPGRPSLSHRASNSAGSVRSRKRHTRGEGDSMREHSHGALRLKTRRGFTLIELLVVICIIGILIAFLLPATRSARPAARRAQCENNLHQIAIALHNYESTYRALPPAYTVDEAGRPLHSWRTLILPFLDCKPLYDSIDLSKPWDDPANAAALASMPYVYRCFAAEIPSNCTTYLGLVSPTACFQPTESRPLAGITDPHSSTLMVIEVPAEDAVPWMAPQDTDGGLLLAFGRDTRFSHEGGTPAAFVDGSVRFLSADTANKVLRAMITIAGDEDVAD